MTDAVAPGRARPRVKHTIEGPVVILPVDLLADYRVIGPAVIVSARTAAFLEATFDLAGLRMASRGSDPRVHQELHDLHGVAATWTATHGVGSLRGTSEPATGQIAEMAPALEPMTTTAVATAAGCTARAVTKAATSGCLQGHKAGGVWLFQPRAVDAWLITRRPRSTTT